MALPTPTKTWIYTVNQLYATGSSMLENYRTLWIAIKDLMKANGWTVRSSSNASSVGANTDYWTSNSSLTWPPDTFTASWPRSWIVLRHPTTSYEVLFSCDQNGYIGTNLQPWNMTMMAARDGYSQSGLLTYAWPSSNTANDSYTVVYRSNTWFWAYPGNNANQAFVLHYMRSDDNKCHRILVYSNDIAYALICLDVPNSPATGWTTTATDPMVFHGYVNNGQLGTGTYTSNAYIATRYGANAPYNVYLGGKGYSTGLLTNNLTIPNEVTGEYPMVAATYYSSTAGTRGRIGSAVDLWFGVSNMGAGTTYPADNTRQFAQHGTLITPWNGSAIATR